jgi:hypothetical protein
LHGAFSHTQKFFLNSTRGRKLNAIREFARESLKASTRCSQQLGNTPLTALLAGVKSATRIDTLRVDSRSQNNHKIAVRLKAEASSGMSPLAGVMNATQPDWSGLFL